MKRLEKFIDSYWPVILLTSIALVVAFLNIVPGTYLTGWDNLHPEFDFKTNIIERSVFSVWQEYQGLGVLAGNAHAADLPRQVLLFLSSIVIPKNLLRYSYHLGAWLTGGIGIYLLISHLLVQNNSKQLKRIIAVLGSLAYLFNLGTVQNFYTPYEAFSHHFAFLPWLIWSLLIYLEKPNKKHLVVLGVLNFLAVPMFYIPTLFFVYLAVLGIVYLGFALSQKSKRTIRSIVLSCTTILTINAFWLLPFIYFVNLGTDFVRESSINRIFSEEAFLRNQKFGSIKEVALFKGFWFDTTDLQDFQGDHQYMMHPWIENLSKPWVPPLMYTLFAASVVGAAISIFTHRPYAAIFTALFAIGIFALINANPPTGFLFTFFQDKLPLFKQVFRFPYTKFIVLTVLAYSVSLAWFADMVVHSLKKLWPKLEVKFIHSVVIAALLLPILVAGWPVFNGHLFYDKLRVTLPGEYFDVFAYFQKEPDRGRIANLPQPTFWGWTTYDWGYRGSGFPWHGIPQPMPDRAFDVWNLKNEDYYHELSHALYNESESVLFYQVLDKYRIEYIWLDDRIISRHKPELSNLETVTKWLGEGQFKLVLSSGKQKIYKRTQALPQATITATVPLATNQKFTAVDQYYEQFGNYYQDNQNGLVYPFSALDSPKSQWQVESRLSGVYLEAEIPATANALHYDFSTQSVVKAQTRFTENGMLLSVLPIEILAGSEGINPPGSQQLVPFSLPQTPYALRINDILYTSDNLPEETFVRNQANELVHYDLANTKYEDISQNLFYAYFSNCSESPSSDKTEFKKLDPDNPDVLTLYGSFSRPCQFNRLKDISLLRGVTKDTVMDISFQVLPITASTVELCLTKEGEEDCYFRRSVSLSQSANTWETQRFLVFNRDIPLNKIWVKLELDAEDKTGQKVSIKNVKVQVLDKTISRQSFDLSGSEFSYEIKAPTERISVPIDGYLVKDIRLADVPNTPKNCFVLGTGEFDRKIVADSKAGTFVRYEAKDASSCETIQLSGVTNREGLLILITGRNVSGRPIKACLRHDPPGNCLFEDILSLTSDWTTVKFVVPPVTTTYQDYYLEFDNYAVGPEVRINDISTIQIYEIPYKTIKLLSAGTSNQSMTRQSGDLTESAPTITHPNPAEYWVKVDQSVNLDNKTLVLSQSFNPGWKAYQVVSCKRSVVSCRIKNFLSRISPFIFGEELKDHVLVNNWANGWLLPQPVVSGKLYVVSEKNPTTYNLQPTTIYIFFWPQILQFVGFGLLMLPVVYFLRSKSGT